MTHEERIAQLEGLIAELERVAGVPRENSHGYGYQAGIGGHHQVCNLSHQPVLSPSLGGFHAIRLEEGLHGFVPEAGLLSP